MERENTHVSYLCFSNDIYPSRFNIKVTRSMLPDGERAMWDMQQGYHPWAGSEKTRRLRCQIISRFQTSRISWRMLLQTGQTEEHA